MSEKLSLLTRITEWLDGSLLYTVDPSRTEGDQSVGIEKQDFLNSMGANTGIPTVVSAIWVEDLDFFVTADALYIDGTLYSATADTVTLDASPGGGLDRLDYLGFYVSTGLVGKATGVPATPSLVVEPDFDPSDFYPIKLVLVKDGDTTPSDPTTGDPSDTDLIFDEDTGAPTEWTLSLSGGDLAVTTNDPYNGTKSIEATDSENTDVMTFTSSTTRNTDDFSALSWWTKLKSSMGGQYIFMGFYNGTKRLGRFHYFQTGSNGLNGDNLSYQKITINRNDFFRLKSGTYTSIKIWYWTHTNFAGWFFDKFEMHGGSTPLPPPTGGDGSGDVSSSTISVDENIVIYDGTTGKVIKDSGVNISDVALKANVLELDNTDSFTPDQDYEPATKKYVDDNSGGSGDMILASIQTVTGAKTFENLKFILRNVADTFNALFTNTNTADRTYTLPDESGNIPLKTGVTSHTDGWVVVSSDFEADLETKVLSAYFDLPYDFTFTEVIGTVITAPTGSSVIADVNVDGTTIMTTDKVEIEATEDSSLDATTQPAITDAAHSKGQRVTIDIDQIGSTIAGTDLEITLTGYQT